MVSIFKNNKSKMSTIVACTYHSYNVPGMNKTTKSDILCLTLCLTQTFLNECLTNQLRLQMSICLDRKPDVPRVYGQREARSVAVYCR